MTEVCVELKAVHTKPEFFGYNSSDHARLQSSKAEIKHIGQLADRAYQINQEIIASPI